MEFTVLVVVELSYLNWVGGFRWPISMSVVRMTLRSWGFTKSAPTSASESEAMALRRIAEAV